MFVIDKGNYKYDFLIDLDIILIFHTCQDHNLMIIQAIKITDKKKDTRHKHKIIWNMENSKKAYLQFTHK